MKKRKWIFGVLAALVLCLLVVLYSLIPHTHQFGDWKDVAEADCVNEGLQERTCSCGEKEQRTIPALGHTEVVDAAVEATCSETGLTEGKHCSVCGEVFTAQQTIPAAGHTEVVDAAVEATCNKTGLTEGKHCSVCNGILTAQETVPATGHSYGKPVWNWNGYTSSTAAFTCANDSSHVVTENAVVTRGVTRAATCEAEGLRTYTAAVTIGGKTYRDTKTEVIGATGHSYGEAVWNWNDYTAATATFTCAHDSSHVETVTAAITNKVTTAVTCLADGVRTYTAEVTFDGKTSADTKTEAIPATGHSYGEPVWSWSDDFTRAAAVFTCANDSSHVVTETAVTTNEVTTAATCETEGVRTYTVEVIFDGKTYTDTKEEVIPATGHSYGEAVWSWNDYTDATATFTCANDSSHVETVTAAITNEVTTAATCLADGVRTYTAEVTFDGKTSADTKTEAIPATGHSYGEPVWGWSDDLTDATAVFTCANDSSHVVTETADITNEVTTAATCETEGVRTYTAEVTFDGKTCTDTKDEVIPATGHSYGEAVWSWSGYTAATATFTCDNDSSHVVTENAAITSKVIKEATCEIIGKRTCTATVTFGGKTYTDTTTEDIPVIPHSYENDICTQCLQPRHSEGLKYTDNSDGTCYVSGIGSCTDTDLVIPRNYQGKAVTSIGKEAFRGCIKLTSVIIPSSVTSIGDYAFNYCSALTGIAIPDSVTSIGSYAFCYCSALTGITFRNGVTNIGSYAFFGCTGLKSIAIPDSVTNIGKLAFAGCNGLTSVTLGNGVTSIGDQVFNSCTSLTGITIPGGVTSIGDLAFANCTGFTSITIPDSVTSIRSTAFQGCSNLGSISVDTGNAVYHSAGNCLIETSAKNLVFGCKNSVIPTDGSVTSISDYAFYGYAGLKSITIPDSVTNIGGYAFYGCSGLKSINIPSGVTSIATNAFARCTGLTNIAIPDSVTTIGKAAFFRCEGLKSITIPNSVTKIDQSAFSACTALTSVTIPGSVTSIGLYAFESCSNLGSVIIKDGVTSIGKYMFKNCSALANVTIGNSVETISDSAFMNCKSLTSITFNGTTSQWNNINKSTTWDAYSGTYTVYCTDGNINK